MSFVVSCPYCDEFILIYEKDTNCLVFRHGIYKNSFRQIDPHLSKPECERLVSNDLIYGCAGPFMIHMETGNHWVARKCGYI
jgi:hypothetical protein